MGNGSQDFKKSSGGISGVHPPQEMPPFRVAPSSGDEHNTIKTGIVPFACWKVEDIRFEFDSSIIKPDMADELQDLSDLIEEHTKGNRRPPASIFGHADPVGQDDYNKQLSGRRAKALYALLTRNVDMWEELYKQPFGGDSWRKKKATSMMLSRLGYGDNKPEIKRFQRDQGLQVDGIMGPDTRKALYKAYMDAICPITLDPQTDFLGRGQDPDGKADYQGCGEFNPLMLFSEEEQKEYSKPEKREERNSENAPNRRVMVFLFRPGIHVKPDRWPCPRAKEGGAGCRKRFWSDGERRRTERLPDQRREYKETKDTFACRFYDRMASRSPCENPNQRTTLHIRLLDVDGKPMIEDPAYRSGVPFRVTLVEIREGISKDGWVEVQMPVYFCPAQSLVEWGSKDASGRYPHNLDLVIHCNQGEVDEKLEAVGKLHNLGYPKEMGLDETIRFFQINEDLEERGLDADGNPPPATMKKLRERYDWAVTEDR